MNTRRTLCGRNICYKISHIKINASTTLANCIGNAEPYFCNLIHRDAAGTLTSGYIQGARPNTGSYGESGIDIAAQYTLPWSAYGRLSFSFDGSVALNNPIAIIPSGASVDCTGL